MTTTALEVAARMLHELTLSHHHIEDGHPPLDGGRYQAWQDLSEPSRRAYRWKAQKAVESPTFEDFYGWMTLAERMSKQDVPGPSGDTERTRGHRAEYYLIQHLLRIDDAVLLTGGAS